MATGQDLVNVSLGFLGQGYSTAPGRDDPGSQHKDCSGLIAASYFVATGEHLGANVSVTIFDLAVRHNLEIPFAFAHRIAGACLLMPEDPYRGWGPAGHIGFSDGQGGTVEATPPKVQRLPITYQPWGSRACLLPGIDYSNGGHGSPAQILTEDSMIYVDNGVAIAVQGNVIVGEWSGDLNEYGIPQGAQEWSANQIPIRFPGDLVIAKLRIADAVAVSKD